MFRDLPYLSLKPPRLEGNANIGLPAIICDTDRIEEGDELELFIDDGKVVNRTRNETLSFSPLPPVMKRILEDGGLVEHVKKYKDLKLT